MQLWTQWARWKIRQDERGQDMVEYALMAAMVAIAAGAIFPPLGDGISTIFSKLNSAATAAGS